MLKEVEVSMSKRAVDLAVVGAGIIGLAHAYLAARAGKSVAIFERHPKAMGASVRNFGMIWPIGQPSGRLHQLALRSRELWLDMLEDFRLPSRRDGSLHVAYRGDEASVIQEFVARAPVLGYECEWLDRKSALTASPALRSDNLLGALWSDTEFTVDPQQILATLPQLLEEHYGVQIHFGTPVYSSSDSVIKTANGLWAADKTIICNGDDFETLYPELFAGSGVTRCKLQMLRTNPQPPGWQLGPALAAGLTLRFYPAFEVCESLPALRKRIAEEMPDYDHWAIHALVSQTANGAITLGDSHEYGLEVDPFNRQEIDELILSYTSHFLHIPDFRIAQRWHGVYAKHPTQAYIDLQPEANVRIVTATGGSGMTMSFGLAEQSLLGLGILRGAIDLTRPSAP
jgi:FAD dependent oxidoreductase TIGR03364